MPKMKPGYLFRIIGFGVVLVASVMSSGFVAQAQTPLKWAPQDKIPMYDVFTEEPPFLIADQNHVVHAFNAQPLELDQTDSPRAIVYRQWTLEDGWTDPMDILLNPNGGNIALMDVYLDQADVVHLAVQMNSQEIYYSQAPLVNAGDASAWSTPKFVGGEALPAGAGLPYTAAITGDGNGNLVIIYSGQRDRNGIYVAYSANSGDDWSEAVPVFLTYDSELVAAGPQLYGDRSGQIHAAWNTFDGRGIGMSGYYARLDLQHRQWSDPIEIDEGGIGLGLKFANIVEYDDDLILTYYSGNANSLWWRRSKDGGVTWSPPARISPRHIGTNGPASFVIDSSNVLHALFGERIDDSNHGMWHTTWTGSGWTEPEPVVRGPQIQDVIGGKGFDPRSAKATIVNGNVLLVTWGTDGAAGENGAWYSYTTLNTPELAAIPLMVPTIEPTATLIPTVTVPVPTPLPTHSPIAHDEIVSSNDVTGSPTTPLVVGLAPVMLLILAFITVHQLRR